jgi:tetratricopeptide (TPR) repeat protein
LRELQHPREAVCDGQVAVAVRPGSAEAHSLLGVAQLELGNYDAAAAALQRAIALDPRFAWAHCHLGGALCGKGKLDEAIACYKKALELNPNFDVARSCLMNVLDQKWKAADLEGKLPQFLKGEAQPADAAEQLALARFCQMDKKLYAAASRFYAQAFAAQPELANYLKNFARYNDACAAALAGCGQGNDAQALAESGRAHLRRQALYWLHGDLDAWRAQLAQGTGQARDAVATQMQHWLADPDFDGVRGPEALGRLPEAERRAWQELWQQVEELRRKSAAPADTAAPASP